MTAEDAARRDPLAATGADAAVTSLRQAVDMARKAIVGRLDSTPQKEAAE